MRARFFASRGVNRACASCAIARRCGVGRQAEVAASSAATRAIRHRCIPQSLFLLMFPLPKNEESVLGCRRLPRALCLRHRLRHQ